MLGAGLRVKGQCNNNNIRCLILGLAREALTGRVRVGFSCSSKESTDCLLAFFLLFPRPFAPAAATVVPFLPEARVSGAREGRAQQGTYS